MGADVRRRASGTSADAGPIGPPLALSAQPALATWLGANVALFNRFTIPAKTTLRYALFEVGVQSGNIQIGLVKLSGTGKLSFERVMDSGVIACPATGNQRVDLGSTEVDPGDYAIFFWADNTTVTVRRASVATMTAMRFASILSSLTTGVDASGSLSNWTDNRYIQLALEGDDPL